MFFSSLFNAVIISWLAQLNALYVCRHDKLVNLLNCEMLKYANIFVTVLTFLIFKKYIRWFNLKKKKKKGNGLGLFELQRDPVWTQWQLPLSARCLEWRCERPHPHQRKTKAVESWAPRSSHSCPIHWEIILRILGIHTQFTLGCCKFCQ